MRKKNLIFYLLHCLHSGMVEGWSLPTTEGRGKKVTAWSMCGRSHVPHVCTCTRLSPAIMTQPLSPDWRRRLRFLRSPRDRNLLRALCGHHSLSRRVEPRTQFKYGVVIEPR